MKGGIATKHAGNIDDDVCIDIEEAHRNFVRQNKRVLKKRYLYPTGLLVKSRLWKRLIDSCFIRDWFIVYKFVEGPWGGGNQLTDNETMH